MKQTRLWLATIAALLCSLTASAATITFADWTSTNKTNNSISSETYRFFTADEGGTLSFSWSVSSETDYDKLIVTLDGTTILEKSGSQSGNYSNVISQGSHTLVVKYTKDSSESYGYDRAIVSNIVITGVSDVIDGLVYLTSGTTASVSVAIDTVAIAIPSSVTIDGNVYVVNAIGDNAFYGCSSLTAITIPESVTSIGDEAFYNCSSLTSITLPEGVTSIGDKAFYWCKSLTSITLPEGVTSIGDEAFYNCSSLTAITIPEGVTSIGYGAFSGCQSLTDMRVNIASIESWLNNNFSSSLVESYSLYLDGELLSSVEIPSSVTSIPNHAFYKCNSIISVIIPEGVTMIGENAFQNCSALTIAVLPKSLSMIKKNAFYGCYNLGSIIIPENVEFIYQEAFAACRALESIKVLATEPPFAYDNTFSNYDIELCVPEEAMEAYRTTAPWSKFTSIRNLEGEEVEVKQCAAPVIDYIDGQVVLTCETEGVTFKSSITADDARSYDEAIYALTGIYTITAQATKEGYLDSETVTATLCWVPCDENHGGETTDIITIPAKPVLIQTNGGTITVNGLAEGTVVKVNDLNGVELGIATATGGTATITTSLTAGNVAIVKIGERSVKVAIK